MVSSECVSRLSILCTSSDAKLGSEMVRWMRACRACFIDLISAKDIRLGSVILRVGSSSGSAAAAAAWLLPSSFSNSTPTLALLPLD